MTHSSSPPTNCTRWICTGGQPIIWARRRFICETTDLLILQPGSFHPHGLTPEAFDNLFTPDKPVVFNFHGYPVAVKQLLFDRPAFPRFSN